MAMNKLRPGTSTHPAGTGQDERNLVDMEQVISRILRAGVISSSAVIMVGLVFMLAAHSTGYGPIGSYHLNVLMQYLGHRAPDFPISVPAVASGVMRGRPFAIIMLGILMLIATPVVRVAVAVVAFNIEKDRAYAAISLYVLLVLIFSFILGRSIG